MKILIVDDDADSRAFWERALMKQGYFVASAANGARARDPVINGYPNEYSQVLLNILINARDAFLASKTKSPLITIRVSAEDGKAVVTVTDNAGGIPSDVIDRVFEPYFTTKSSDQGTGIGLFLAKNIVEKNMKGVLSVCNVDNGAQFRIEI